MWSPRVINGSVYLLALASLVAGYLIVSDVLKKHYEEALDVILTSNLNRAENSIDRWIDNRIQEASAFARDPVIEASTYALLAASRDVISLQVEPAQTRLRRFFQSTHHNKRTDGYFIIALDGTTLAASQDIQIGIPNIILSQPVNFDRVLTGTPIFSGLLHPIPSNTQNGDINDVGSSLAAAPVKDKDGRVVAILALQMNPREELFQLINFAETESGMQTYAFNRQGALLSHVREFDALRESGVWRQGEDHILLEPENLRGGVPDDPRLILPVRRALQGAPGTDTQGYLNFAGEEKVAAWTFFDDLGFGLVVELPKGSAYGMAKFFQNLTIIAFSIGLIVATVVFLIMLEAGKRAEANRQKLAATLAATRDVSFQVNKDGIILHVNQALKQVFGVNAEDSLGHSVSRFLDLGGYSQVQLSGKGLRGLVQLKLTQVIRCNGLRSDGESFPVGIRVESLSAEGKAPDEFLIVVHDYSEIQRRELELREALQRAEAGNRTKSSFLSTISHELRSPLISVIAALELLTDRVNAAEDRNLLDSSQRSAQILLGIIDDILDYSRMEAGKLELTPQPTSLERVLSDVVDVLRWQAWNNHVELTPFCEPGVPLVQADGLRLRQILLNLVSNAVKFSAQMKHPGKVSVSVSTRKTRNGNLTAVFRVRDNGIGMSPEIMEQIFQPFTQADGSIRRKYGGTGLGLTISDRLIKMMDGHISVMSDLGEGTVFEVELPLPLAESDIDTHAAKTTALKGQKVLIQAEEPAVADTLRIYCRYAGAEVATLTPGGLLAKEFKPTLLVVQSPLLTDLKRLQKTYGRVPALRIVNHGKDVIPTQPGNDTIALTSLVPSEVIEKLQQLLIGGSAAQTQLSIIPQSKVLLVEDDEMTREITLRMLTQLGISADAVVNGQEGLDLWRSGQYAMLLSDCHMPIMDGFQMAARIRDEEVQRKLPKTPIIAVSADLTMEVERLCVDCEIDEYVPKPLTPAKLKTILQAHLGGKRGHLDS